MIFAFCFVTMITVVCVSNGVSQNTLGIHFSSSYEVRVILVVKS